MGDAGAVLESCRLDDRAAFVPYLVAANPDLETSAELAAAVVRGGADLLALGVAFTDPIVESSICDEPIIQRAGERALESGGSLSAVLELVARNRVKLGVPVVLISYFNPLLARGARTFAEQAASSGVDSVLTLDLPPEEGERELGPALREAGVDPVYMLTAGATRRRARRISESSRGFVLGMPASGTSNARDPVPEHLLKRATRMRKRIELPMVVGLSVATPEQVGQVGQVADGVIVGSALTLTIERHLEDDDLIARVEAWARGLRAGIA